MYLGAHGFLKVDSIWNSPPGLVDSDQIKKGDDFSCQTMETIVKKKTKKLETRESEELHKYKYLFFKIMIDHKKWYLCKYNQHSRCNKNNIDCDFYHETDNGSEDYEQASKQVY